MEDDQPADSAVPGPPTVPASDSATPGPSTVSVSDSASTSTLTRHSSQKLYKCPLCDFQTDHKRGLATHTGAIHAKKRAVRLPASQRTPVPSDAAETQGPLDPMYRCDICSFQSRFRVGLNQHIGRMHPQSLTGRAPITGPSSGISSPCHLISFKLSRPLVAFPPKNARFILAKKLLELLERVAVSNSPDAWSSLLLFGFKTLHLDSRKANMVSQITDNIAAFDEPMRTEQPTSRRLRSRELTDEEIAAAAARRLKVFADVGGAVRILTSEEKLVSPNTPGAFEEMLEKHPPAQLADVLVDLPAPDDNFRPACSPEEVMFQLKSFRKGVAGGMDSITAAHLLSLTTFSPTLQDRMLRALANICDIIISGNVPEDARDSLFGAWLIAQTKKSGGLRPIAIGSIFRRLATKIALRRVQTRLGEHLRPRQLGFGTKSGAEAAVHTVRSFLRSTPKCTIVKIDFANAFNSHFRGPMLHQVHEHAPELYNLAHYAYARPTPLFFGERRIPSESGCQQGDPSAPLLFSLTLQPILLQLKCKLVVSYLDDLTLSDPDPDVVAADLQLLQLSVATTGLKINASKCELFYQGMTDIQERDLSLRFSGILEDSKLCQEENLELLGAALFPIGTTEPIRRLASRLSRMHARLPLMPAQAAYFLLRHSLGIPRVIYFLRASPAFMAPPDLQILDSVLLRCAEVCLNISLDAPARAQLQLPVSSGGLGLRSPSSLALSAFLSSAHSCKDIVEDHLGPDASVALLDEALQEWNEVHGDTLPEDDSRGSQRAWDKIYLAQAKSQLQDILPSTTNDSVRFAHVSQPESGLWLNVRPDDNLGTVLTDPEFRTVCGLRLGLDIFAPSPCACGEPVSDAKGHHKLSCKQAASLREARHNAVNDVLVRAFRHAGFAVRAEPTHLCADDNIRPDGMTLTPWALGKMLIWDVSVRNTYAASYTALSRTVGGVARKAEKDKTMHYQALKETHIICPFIVESSGVWGQEAMNVTRIVGKLIEKSTGEKRSTSFLRQRVALEVQRGNARMILGTLPKGRKLDEILYI